MSTPSTARNPLPNRFVSPLVWTIVLFRGHHAHLLCAMPPKNPSQFGRIGARPAPGSKLHQVEARTST
jgi:hypothetical protein